MRTRLTLPAVLALALLLALPTATPALTTPGDGHHGSSGSGGNHGSSGSGSGKEDDDSSGRSGHDEADDDAGAGHETRSSAPRRGAVRVDDNRTARAARTTTTSVPAAGPPVGRVADQQAGHPRPSTPPAAAGPATGTSGSARTPTSVAVVAAGFVLAAMVAAGFRARARLGRLG